MSRLVRLVRLIGGGVLVVAVAGAGLWLVQGGIASGASPSSTGDPDADDAVQTAAVERKTLTVTEELDATLGYAGEYGIIGGLGGTLTWAVPVGTVVGSGQPLYEVDGKKRVSLMLGSRPAWRTLEPDMSDGYDVRQLEENLLLLGYTRKGDVIDRHWDDDTTAAVKRWQKAAGLTVDGIVDLGEVVFLTEPIRVTKVEATLGQNVGPGGPVLTGTSNRRVVSLDLSADDRDLLEVGDAVQITLPDDSTIDGTVATIGTVAETVTDQQGGTSTTLPVTITLDDATAAADLDEAPVEIVVVRSSREDVLTVPVNALIALLEGGYAVEVVEGEAAAPDASADPGASSSESTTGLSTRLVPVDPGLFDRGFVEITADDLEAGDLVVVPS